MTFDQLKSLRLVCKSFNDAASPRVMSCVRLFGNGDNSMSNMRQLKAIVSSGRKGPLHDTETLIMGHWISNHGCVLYVPVREMRNSGMWVCGIIANCTIVPLMWTGISLVEPSFVVLKMYDSVARLRTRICLSRASILNMPNVRRVV